MLLLVLMLTLVPPVAQVFLAVISLCPCFPGNISRPGADTIVSPCSTTVSDGNYVLLCASQKCFNTRIDLQQLPCDVTVRPTIT